MTNGSSHLIGPTDDLGSMTTSHRGGDRSKVHEVYIPSFEDNRRTVDIVMMQARAFQGSMSHRVLMADAREAREEKK